MNHSEAVESKGPILAFTGILLVGILLAGFFFILPKMNQDAAEAANDPDKVAAADPATPKPGPATPVAKPQTPAPPAPGPGTPAPVPGADGKPSPYLTDSVLVTDLIGKLKSGDVAGFAEVAGPKAATDQIVARMKNLIGSRDYTPDPNEPLTEIGPVGASGKRWVLNLLPPAEHLDLGAQKIQLDLLKDPVLGWKVSVIDAPDIEAIAAALGKPPAPGAAQVKREPLDAAKLFVEAVVARNFRNAKAHIQSDKLSDEKLAALFIIVEEGKFKPHPETPLIESIKKDTISWVIAKLVSPDRQSEFGIEMGREAVGEPWKINGLNFDQLMQSVAAAAGAGEVAYTEIRTNLKGGDSLVLYFAYDEDGVNTRANRQLEIIADILKEDSKRTIHINGHADARGDETYNSQLSDSRAVNVRETLLALGVPPAQVVTRAFGESAPKAPNFNPDGTDNTSGQAQNRRAEVYLKF